MSNDLKFILSVDSASGRGELRRFSDELRNVGGAATQAAGVSTKAIGAIGEAFKSALAAGVGFGAGLSAVKIGATLADWAKAAVSTGIAFDSLKQQATIAFTTMLGDGQKAKAYLQDLADFAARTPFEFPDLLKASQRLIAMGFAAKDVKPLLTAVGDAAAGLGQGKEAIDRVTLALGQMQGRGKVATQEMNQLTEVGIPAWDMLAQKLGVTRSKLQDMVEQGAVPAGKAIAVLVDGMNEKFGGMMDQQSKTLAGLQSTFVDLSRSIAGELVQGGFELLSGATEHAVNVMTVFNNNLKGLPNSIDDSLPRLATLTVAFDELAAAMRAASPGGGFVRVGRDMVQLPTLAQGQQAVVAAQNKEIADLALSAGVSPRDVNQAIDMLTQQGMSRRKAIDQYKKFQSSGFGGTVSDGELQRLQDSLNGPQALSKEQLRQQEQFLKMRRDYRDYFKKDQLHAYRNAQIKGGPFESDIQAGLYKNDEIAKKIIDEQKARDKMYNDFGDFQIDNKKYWHSQEAELRNKLAENGGLTPANADDVRRFESLSDVEVRNIRKRYDELKHEQKKFTDAFRQGAGEVWDAFFIKGQNVLTSLANFGKGLLNTIGRTLFQDIATGLVSGGRGGGIFGLGSRGGSQSGIASLPGVIMNYSGRGGLLGRDLGAIGLGGLFAGGTAAASSVPLAAVAGGFVPEIPLSAIGGGLSATGAGTAGGSGLMASMGAFMTNPWTIGIAAGILGGIGLWKLFGGKRKEDEKPTTDPFGFTRERTMWFNSTYPFEKMANNVNETLGNLNGTIQGLNKNLQRFDTMSPGALALRGWPAVVPQMKKSLNEEIGADREFRRGLAGGILEEPI